MTKIIHVQDTVEKLFPEKNYCAAPVGHGHFMNNFEIFVMPQDKDTMAASQMSFKRT